MVCHRKSNVQLTCLVVVRYVTGYQCWVPFQAGWGLAMLSSRELGTENGAFCLRELGTRMAR